MAGIPKRFGKLLDYASFDAAFFKVHGRQAQVRAPSPMTSQSVTHLNLRDLGTISSVQSYSTKAEGGVHFNLSRLMRQ